MDGRVSTLGPNVSKQKCRKRIEPTKVGRHENPMKIHLPADASCSRGHDGSPMIANDLLQSHAEECDLCMFSSVVDLVWTYAPVHKQEQTRFSTLALPHVCV